MVIGKSVKYLYIKLGKDGCNSKFRPTVKSTPILTKGGKRGKIYLQASKKINDFTHLNNKVIGSSGGNAQKRKRGKIGTKTIIYTPENIKVTRGESTVVDSLEDKEKIEIDQTGHYSLKMNCSSIYVLSFISSGEKIFRELIKSNAISAESDSLFRFSKTTIVAFKSLFNSNRIINKPLKLNFPAVLYIPDQKINIERIKNFLQINSGYIYSDNRDVLKTFRTYLNWKTTSSIRPLRTYLTKIKNI